MAAIRAGEIGCKCDSAVFRPGVGVNQQFRLCIQAFLFENHILVLQAVVVAVEVSATLLVGNGIALVIPKLTHALLDGDAFRDGIEIGKCYFVLCPNPAVNGLAFPHIVFEPAVAVCHFRAVVVVDMIHCIRDGISQSSGLFDDFDRLGNRFGTGTEEYR